ncbi:hypothetical protein AADZ90_012200 [Aestuariibius sp. 2305UL40-4]|uniref:hypothetical protein n=1 Tax=Aestuariibius violaceus TaxID=3234132 RepID=UPI00345E9A48
MFFLRTFALSFSIYWRFLIVVPLIGLLFIAFFVAAIGIGFVLSLVSLPLAVIVIAMLILIANAIPLLIALRLGASAKGEEVNGTYRDLFLPALGYGFIEMLAVMILSAIVVFAVAVLSPYGVSELQDFLSEAETVPETAFEDVSTIVPLFAAPFLIFVAASIVRAALLVPMTASAVGAGMHGRSYPFLWKVGGGFIPVFIICLISFLSPVLIGIAGNQVLQVIGLDDEIRQFWDAFQNRQTGSFFDVPFATEGYAVGAISLLLLLWFFCLQAAAGVTAFRKIATIEDHTLAEERQVDRMSAEDLRAMRKSRQQSGL